MPKVVFYNKRIPLAELEMEGTKVLRITDVTDTKHLPVCLEDDFTPESVNKWIDKRKIPEKREGLVKARKRFPGFENYDNMFSLSDQYWFQRREDETWDGLNFFTNRYKDTCGKIFFMPWDADPEDVGSPSPDFTTNGVLRKMWTQSRDLTSCLVKAGSHKYHQEPLSEVLASIMLKRLDIIPYVSYELIVNGMRLCSKCRNFIDENTEFVPAAHLYNKVKRKQDETVYDHLLLVCGMYGIKGTREYLNHMITADHIIGNTDRHLGNFGFIRDVASAKIIGFAPLFDSGSAFWGGLNDAKRARLFSTQEEKAALHEVLPDMNLDIVMDHRDMFTLVDSYPEIGSAQKKNIKNRIILSERELCGLKGRRKEMTRGKDDVPDR